MINEYTLAEAYQPLFDFMSREYGKTLIKSEMDEIIEVVDKVNENLTELFRIKCDVERCNESACSQGISWSDTGYWCTCRKHSADAREGKPEPKMKEEAIQREEKRKLHPKGYLE